VVSTKVQASDSEENKSCFLSKTFPSITNLFTNFFFVCCCNKQLKANGDVLIFYKGNITRV
jgi:hypothetical protein